MSIRVVFLGTSGSVPTLKRSLPSVVVQCRQDQIMFDCGENTQRQMIQAKVSFHKKLSVFITHLHGDHVLGLPGMLQTMALMERKEPVHVYGPVGIKDYLFCNKETLKFSLNYSLEIEEIQGEGSIYQSTECGVKAFSSNHAVKSYFFALEEKPRFGKFYPDKAIALEIPKGELWSKLQRGEEVKTPSGKVVKPDQVTGPIRRGRKIIYTGDTKPFENFAKHAIDADLVIHDCTFDDSLFEKAGIDGHSTPIQAATQAKAAQAKQLVLTHISARYPDATILLEQAKKLFPNTILAEDFLVLELPLIE